MKAITITLDGIEVSGYPGTTILKLAEESGVAIPTLCNNAHLLPGGACRMCLVENQPAGKLLAACVTPIAPGMVINTKSSMVNQHRRTIIELILASHPDTCMVCDKGNRCELRQIAADIGIGFSELARVPQPATVEEVNPFIVRDMGKCILCAKCIRACQELVVVGAIDYFHRGFDARPATLGDAALESSECTFCGTCIAMCPTGALIEKEVVYHGTGNRTVETTCPYCGCGCSLRLEVKDNRVVRATPGTESKTGNGTLCVRGSYGYDFITSSDRLTSPLVKTDEGFREVTWDEALERVAAGFMQLQEKDGADSLAILGSSKCTNEENYLLSRFARCVLGTNNIDSGSRLYNHTGPASFSDISLLSALEHSGVIMVIGANPTISAPAVEYAIKRAVKQRGARLILIDPRETGLARFADCWLRPRLGTDTALLNGLARVIIKERLLDEEYVARKTNDFDALSSHLEGYTPETAESISGVPTAGIMQAARLYAGADRAAIVYGSGITRQTRSADSVRSLDNLTMLTGNTGHGSIYALQMENNAQGAADMGTLPDYYPGYRNVTDTRQRSDLEKHWECSLPAEIGLNALEMIQGAAAGKIKGLYIVGENPALSFPHQDLTNQALNSLDFLVVQDMFLTETAKLADVVLPAASFAEKDGSTTNFEGLVRPIRQAVDSPGESLPDWLIILKLAEKIGVVLPFCTPKEVMAEIEEVVSWYEDYSEGKADYLEPGTRGQSTQGFRTFYLVDYLSRDSGNTADYPFVLMTGSILGHFGSGTRSSRSPRLKTFSPDPYVEIGISDAKNHALNEGDTVRITSQVSEIMTTVKITGALESGMLFLPMSFPQTPTGRLFAFKLNDEKKSPAMNAVNVKIEKVSENA